MATDQANPQAGHWNGRGGCSWVDLQPVMDGLLDPLLHVLVDAVDEVAAATGAGRVLDVGCGTGATTLAIARRLGTDGSCTGVDISEPMLEAARQRAEGDGVEARFVCADAQRHPFERAGYDVIASRFGVMFFGDPVAAFANLRGATAEGGALRALVWRSAEENPFMTTAERAAAPLLTIPERDPDGPGQFAFGAEARVRSILDGGGWRDVDLRPVDVTCRLAQADLTTYVTRLGLVGQALASADADTRARVTEVVVPAFDPFVDGDEVRFTAACWLVRAEA